VIARTASAQSLASGAANQGWPPPWANTGALTLEGTMANCNADVGHRCDVDNGRPCARCAEYEAEIEAEARRAWRAASPQERDPEKYEQDLKDAGRWR
jgi:hypothetical protein